MPWRVAHANPCVVAWPSWAYRRRPTRSAAASLPSWSALSWAPRRTDSAGIGAHSPVPPASGVCWAKRYGRGRWAANSLSIPYRINSLTVRRRVEASASSRAYSPSLTVVPRDLVRSGCFTTHHRQVEGNSGRKPQLQLPQHGTPKNFSELPHRNSKFLYGNPLPPCSS